MNQQQKMTKVLMIKSSPSGEHSVSSEVADHLMSQLKERSTNYQFTIRDLNQAPAPQYTSEVLDAFYSDQTTLNDAQKAISAPSERYIDELKAADIIVFASPMHNFSISSLLKSYIDQICRIGYTFSYSANGPEGLVKGKQAMIISSAGMDFQNDEHQAIDFQTPYLEHVLRFIGFESIHVVPVQGLGRSDIDPQMIKNIAKEKVSQLAHANF